MDHKSGTFAGTYAVVVYLQVLAQGCDVWNNISVVTGNLYAGSGLSIHNTAVRMPKVGQAVDEEEEEEAEGKGAPPPYAPTPPCSLLIAGATGNTGVGVVRTLSSLNVNSRIIALTRDTQAPTSKELAALPGVDVVEKDWTTVDAAWLRDNNVKRVFIASHNHPSHFVDESLFLNYALQAGVEYTVRISTTKANVGPTTPVFYGRSHWAIEAMLSTPEFKAMQWTSLQPNVFTQAVVAGMAGWLQAYRQTGTKGTFKTMLDKDAPVALVDGAEVGNVAGTLLALADVSAHNGRKYVIVGPSNTNGKEQVGLLERLAGTTIDNVVYRDVTWVEYMPSLPPNLVPSIVLAPRSGYNGGSSVEESPTSPEVMALCPPKHAALQQMEKMLK